MKSWQQSNKDPLDLSGRKKRQAEIDLRKGKTNLERISYLKHLALGKKVLDVGCVQNDASCRKNPLWLHRHLAQVAAEIMGIDILEEDLAILRKEGFRVCHHDLTQKPYPDTFEVIIAGEILEHIDNPGAFFANCHRSLLPGGVVIVTTPFPWFLGTSLRNSLSGLPLGGSLEHVSWFDPFNVFELCERYGFELKKWHGLCPSPVQGGFFRFFFEGVARLIRKGLVPPLSSLTGCRSILYECEKKGESKDLGKKIDLK